MDSDIAKLPATTFSGHRVTRRQIEDIKWTAENITHSSRNDLARTICEHLNWRTRKRATTRSGPAWPLSKRWRRRES